MMCIYGLEKMERDGHIKITILYWKRVFVYGKTHIVEHYSIIKSIPWIFVSSVAVAINNNSNKQL